MADEEHVKKLSEGFTAWNAWREKNPDLEPNLAGEKLGSLDLSRANLSRANLVGVDLAGARLHGTDFSLGNLSEAKLFGTFLSGVNLSGAKFDQASLFGAIFIHNRMDGTLFGGARLIDCVFAGINLSNARGLDQIMSIGPSSVGIDTLVQSEGQIPEAFLQGCGFSRWEILNAKLYDPSLTPSELSEITNDIVQERSKGYFFGGVFISYSHEDKAFVDKLEEGLRSEGANVWLDRRRMRAGSITKQVERAIRSHDIVLIVLSESSVEESTWVEQELEWAFEKEQREKREVLCPVMLDDAWLVKSKDYPIWGKLRRNTFAENFSDWDKGGFDPAFAKLLEGLKVNYGPAVAAEAGA